MATADQLLAYIESPSVHLVQFQLEEAVDNLLVNAGMNVRVLHKRKRVKGYVLFFLSYTKIVQIESIISSLLEYFAEVQPFLYKGTILFVISQILIKQIILTLSNNNEAKKQFKVK